MKNKKKEKMKMSIINLEVY